MRAPSQEIFELVKSLTGTEQRFFQLHSRRHVIGEGNNYWLLFNLILQQDAYDEASLKAKWAAHGNPLHFAVIKQQLYHQLLQALHLYHAGTDTKEQVRMALHQSEILLNKGLYAQADKQLKKQRKLIEKEELLELWPEYYKLVHKLWGKQYYQGIAPEQLEQLGNEEEKALTQMYQAAQVRQQAERISMLHYRKVGGRSVADVAVIDSLLVQLPKLDGLPMRTQMDVLNATATAHFMKGDAAKAYEYNGRLLQLIEQNGLIKSYAERYFSILNNYLVDSQILGHQEQVRDGLKKLRGLAVDAAFKKIPRLEVNVFRLGYQLELNLALASGKFEDAQRLAAEVDVGLKRYTGQVVLHNQIVFQYLLAYLSFGNSRWTEALDRLAWIINETDQSAVQEIQGFARLLSLIVHYEAGHYRLLESLVESVYRYQKQRQQLFETERQVITFLRKINFVEERHIHDALFRAFLVRTEELRKLPNEQRAFNYFDFGIWAQAHLKKKPFAEIYQKRLVV